MFNIITKKLTDGSLVYDVVGYDRNRRVTLAVVDLRHAQELCKNLNDCVNLCVDILGE